MCIAVDGPVGAGKSSAARELARRLMVLHLDTGAMYRAVGVAALEAGVDLNDRASIEDINARSDVTATFENGAQRTWLNGRDVSEAIRTPDASTAASAVSVVGAVRSDMLIRQRAIAGDIDVVMDGRDIGTRVLPEATVKFYLDASPETRAKRRMDELAAKGDVAPFERVLADVLARDHRDSVRELDPLRPAADAIIIDTTHMTPGDVVERMLAIVREKTRYE